MPTQLVTQTDLFINGSFQPASTGNRFATLNPMTEEVIVEVAQGSAEDVDRAVRAAKDALDSWRETPGRARGALMYALVDLIEANEHELAELERLDTGKPLPSALGDIRECAEVMRYYAGWADKLHGKQIPTGGGHFSVQMREPVGVCGLIVPWNYPMLMICWKLGPLLATGCTGVIKPAEQTPLTALRLAELIKEAKIPDGVVNIVTGFGHEAGAALTEHPMVNKIAFTGSGETANIIRQTIASSDKRASFELGGKSANIVFDDASFERAVDGAINAIFANNGQNCCAGSRLFVQEGIYPAFMAKFQEKVANLDDLGPLIDQAQFDKVSRYIALGQKEGATLTYGGTRLKEKGYYIAPTIFTDVTDAMAIAKEEIFGPVVSVLKFSTVNEAIERANASPYGLAAGVWSESLQTIQHASTKLQAGTVWVNCYNVCDCATPFGGHKSSGTGRDLGEASLDGYTELKTITTSFSTS